MDDVAAAQVLHPTSNVQHEVQERLQVEVLEEITMLKEVPDVPATAAACCMTLTNGWSPSRDRSRNVCRSPCFMNGRTTIGTGNRWPGRRCRLTPI